VVQSSSEAHGYSRKSISTLIREARRRGLLTPTRIGRPGGQLTMKARALLSGRSPEELANAWERATEDERAGALERERVREEREAVLLADFNAGKIDAATYKARMVALGEELVQ
jgi:hypothetical protein